MKKAWRPLGVCGRADPVAGPVGGQPGLAPDPGIGAGFIPAIMDTSLLDGIIQVEPPAAKEMAKPRGEGGRHAVG